jgi:hypothetical protein
MKSVVAELSSCGCTIRLEAGLLMVISLPRSGHGAAVRARCRVPRRFNPQG